MLANLPYSVLPNSMARTVDVQQWWAPYCLKAAAREHEDARRAQAEADSLRDQQAHGARPAARNRRCAG
ncbi:hypothetical protein ACWDSD_42580 [Streptomyces spiralis]